MNEIDKLRYTFVKEKVLQICKEHQNQPINKQDDEKPTWLKDMYYKVKLKREYKDENDKKYHETVDNIFNFPSTLYSKMTNYSSNFKDYLISILPQTEQGRNQSFMALLIL